MSIDLVLNAPKTPARTASIKSMQLSMAGDAQGWLDLFAEDAVVQDPYGPSPMDPEGKGHVGKAAIEKFCAAYIKPDRIRSRTDLPAPLPPTMTVILPAGISAEVSSSRTLSSALTVRLCNTSGRTAGSSSTVRSGGGGSAVVLRDRVSGAFKALPPAIRGRP